MNLLIIMNAIKEEKSQLNPHVLVQSKFSGSYHTGLTQPMSFFLLPAAALFVMKIRGTETPPCSWTSRRTMKRRRRWGEEGGTGQIWTHPRMSMSIQTDSSPDCVTFLLSFHFPFLCRLAPHPNPPCPNPRDPVPL